MSNPLRIALDRAIDSFVRDIVALFAETIAPTPAQQHRGNNAPHRAPNRAPATAAVKRQTAVAAPRPSGSDHRNDVVAAPPPAQQAMPARPALPRNVVALRRGTDIHTVAANARVEPVTELPEFLRALEPERPKGPTPEQLGERVVGMLWAAEGPMVFERIRLALATKKDILTPVIDKLLAENRISATEVDGVPAYKPPRIEPIRRRRPAEA